MCNDQEIAMRRTLLPLFALFLAIPASASITGVVINPDGQPVAGANVSLCAPESIEARRGRLLSKTPERPAIATMTTDSQGTFRFDSPKDQPVVDVRIAANGFAPDAVRLLADDDAGAIALTPASMQRGTITANGKPVAGATVVWMGDNTDYLSTTDADGHYTAPDPSKWVNRLAIAHPDYAIHQEMIRNESKRLDRALTGGVTISGHVVAQDGHTPVAKAALLVDDIPLATTSDDGSFTIAHAPKEWQQVEGRSGNLSGVRARAGDASLNIRLAKLGMITGAVRDARTQLPLVNAEVRLGPDTQFGRARGFGAANGQAAIKSALTDAKGVFTIATPPGRYSLMAIYPGSVISNTTISVVAGQTVNKALYATARARVSGTVIDDQKRAVAGARIVARDTNRGGGFILMLPDRLQPDSGAASGPDGRFVLRNVLTETDLHIDATKKGLPPASSATLRLNSGEKKTGLILTIPRGVVFSGKVTSGDGRPLSGVAVEASLSEAGGRGLAVRRVVMSMMRDRNDDDVIRTGSDGAFALRLKEGTYDVVFKREGFATKTLRAQTVSTSTQPVTVNLDPGAEISGRVVRAGSGVEGVNVNAISQDGNASAVTTSDGSFTLTDLTPGQMMLSATKPDAFIQQIRPVTAPARDMVIELPAGGRITGRVLDKTNKVPVTSFQAGISTSRSGGGMTIMTPPMLKPFTSDDGTFVLENVPPGPTQLVVSAPGYSMQHVPGLNVEDGKTLSEVEVDLESGGRLSGRVTAPEGGPLSGVSVRLDSMAGAGPGRVMRFDATDNSTVTDPNGEYSIDSIDPGEKTFTFTRQGYLSESRTVNIAGKDSRLDVQLSLGVSLTGVVTTDAGVPVPDASVNTMSASDATFGRQTRTDANGQFQISGVAPGHYTITASKTGLADGILRDFDVSSGAPARVVMKAGGTISGHVIGLTDAELQQATVTAIGANGNASAEVDGSGNYRIDGAPIGSVRVSARAGRGLGGGKTSPVKSVEVDPGSSVQVDLQFKSSTVIGGRVTRNGQPLANAIVAFYPRGGQTQGNASSTTDSNGSYTISGLEDGSYSVSVVDFNRSGSFNASYTVSGSSTYDIDIKSATLRGTVVDSTTGEPVADARVQIQTVGGNAPGMLTSRVATTDSSGAFLLDNVQSGSYQATAQKDGYGHDVRNFAIGDTPPDDLQLKIAPSDGVTLRVVDARDNRLLSANVMRVIDAQGREVESGGFRFSSTPEPVRLTLAPGRYNVTLTAMGYAPQVVNVISPSTQTVALTPGGTLLLRSKGSAPQRVRLVDPNGAFYPRGMNGIFTIDPAPLTTTLNNVAAGNYTLQVLDTAGNVTNTIPVTVVQGQQNVVDV